MISVDEALATILRHVVPGPEEKVPLPDGLHRYAMGAPRCEIPIPPFASTSVDGYALAAPGRPGDRLTVAGEQPAGRDRGCVLRAGTCVRVFTGAPVPEGTVAIAMQEDVSPEGIAIILREAVDAGENLRQPGEDLCRGQRLLDIGTRLLPQHLALLASQGLTEVTVCRRPRALIVTTGDELVPGGQTLQKGEIYESNGVMLQTLCRHCDVPSARVIHLRDEPESMKTKLQENMAEADLLLLSGGVSVGKHDHVKAVLEELGMETRFWKVNVKPGKPLLFGSLDRRPIFGLPGNPGSSFVSFWLFCAPALKRMMGCPAEKTSLPTLEADLGERVVNDHPRPHYLRGRLDLHARTFMPLGLQKSHGIHGLTFANALALVPGSSDLAASSPVTACLLGW